MKKNGDMKKKAFTLAEVLLTLSIIGVVAAMTLPILIKNYQKHVLVNQLKKSYSVISQIFQKMMADEGVEKFEDLAFFVKLRGACNISQGENSCDSIMKKYAQTVKSEYLLFNGGKHYYKVETPNGTKEEYLYSGYYYYMELADGAQLWIGGFNKPYIQNVYVDVNGNKGPNTMNRDFYHLQLNGTKITGDTPYCYEEEYSHGSMICTNGVSRGLDRIIADGWKMNY